MLEFLPTEAGHGDIIALGDGGAKQTTRAQVPSDIVIDRCYMRPFSPDLNNPLPNAVLVADNAQIRSRHRGEPESEAAREEGLLLLLPRVVAHALDIAEAALQPIRAVETGTTCHFHSVFDRGDGVTHLAAHVHHQRVAAVAS